jgi:transcriptional regulator with XRE-family HTH domain
MSAAPSKQCGARADARAEAGVPPVSDIGTRLRLARKGAGLSLAQVAAVTGVSPSFLSTVEKGKSDISISRLMRLVHCYQISISDLVEQRRGASVHVVNAADRKAIAFGSEGISISMLAPDGMHMMMPVLNEYAVGGQMADTASHEGEEFIYVLDGIIELRIEGEDPIVLRPGDTAYYQADIPHAFSNVGEALARFIGVATPPNI